MEHSFELFFALCIGHAVVDYGLSTEYVALGKSHKNPVGKGVWPWVLLAHSLMHAGVVYTITGYWILAVGELLLHAITDYLKSDGKINYHVDQSIHYLTKGLWVYMTLYVLS
ncbi:MAG: DUF3307 domain-containing protein [Patescibacteria group bacterium UBA2103]